MPLLLLLGYGRQMQLMFEKRVLARNLFETGRHPLLRGGAGQHADRRCRGARPDHAAARAARRSILFRERIGGLRMALIGLGFTGALMVAQPTMQGISIYAVLGIANAVFCAARDIAGRRGGP